MNARLPLKLLLPSALPTPLLPPALPTPLLPSALPTPLLPPHTGNTVTADGRYGSTTTTSKAYNGSRYNVYYRTPAEFFIGGEMTSTTADTSRTIKGSTPVISYPVNSHRKHVYFINTYSIILLFGCMQRLNVN